MSVRLGGTSKLFFASSIRKYICFEITIDFANNIRRNEQQILLKIYNIKTFVQSFIQKYLTYPMWMNFLCSHPLCHKFHWYFTPIHSIHSLNQHCLAFSTFLWFDVFAENCIRRVYTLLNNKKKKFSYKLLLLPKICNAFNEI